MAAAIRVREDYTAARLRELAKRSDDADQTRRLLALAVIYEGGSRTEAGKIGGVGRQTVRDWVLAFNEEGPDGLINGKRRRSPTLSAAGNVYKVWFARTGRGQTRGVAWVADLRRDAAYAAAGFSPGA